MIGIIGKKLGMTQIFDEAGMQIPCTVVEATPNPVTKVMDPAKVGFAAVELGYGAQRTGLWVAILPLASLVLAPIADRVGTGPILRLTPAGYLLSGVLTWCVLRQHPQPVRYPRVLPVLDAPAGGRAPA